MLNFRKLEVKANQFLSDESGATAVEYVLIAAIMGVGIITGVQTLESAVDTSIGGSGDALTAVQ